MGFIFKRSGADAAGKLSVSFNVAELLEKTLADVEKATRDLGHVNLILLGRSGVGKSTLVNAVFRKPLARVGVGKPVTQRTTCYAMDDLPLRIYDTKGLELGASDQEEVVAEVKNLIDQKAWGDEDEKIHAIWYCVNAESGRIEQKELDWIREFAGMHNGRVRVVVVLTKCFRKKSADALRMEILKELAGRIEQCVMVLAAADEENPKKNPAFGLEELVEVTMRLLPDDKVKALINAQGVSIDAKEKAALKYVTTYMSTAAATVAGGSLAPVPFSDAPLLIANEITMCAHLTAVFGIDLEKHAVVQIATTLLGVSAATIAGKSIVSSVLKLVPGAGTAMGAIVSGTTAAVLTGAVGRSYVAVLVMLAKGELDTASIGDKAFQKKLQGIMKQELKKK